MKEIQSSTLINFRIQFGQEAFWWFSCRSSGWEFWKTTDFRNWIKRLETLNINCFEGLGDIPGEGGSEWQEVVSSGINWTSVDTDISIIVTHLPSHLPKVSLNPPESRREIFSQVQIFLFASKMFRLLMCRITWDNQ